jgi:hypothetical protein
MPGFIVVDLLASWPCSRRAVRGLAVVADMNKETARTPGCGSVCVGVHMCTRGVRATCFTAGGGSIGGDQ